MKNCYNCEYCKKLIVGDGYWIEICAIKNKYIEFIFPYIRAFFCKYYTP